MKKICMGFLVLAAVGSAPAQSYRSVGRGDLMRGRDRQKIEDAKIVFTRSTFSLSIGIKDGRRVIVSGDAEGSGNRRKVFVKNLGGVRNPSGSGEIRMDRDGLKEIDISGDSDSGRYSIKFSGRAEDDDRPPSNGGGISAGGNTTGTGRYRWGRDEGTVKKLVFSLKESGEMTLTVKGDKMRDVTFIGRWTGRGDSRSFTLTRGVRGDDVSGSGTLHLSDDRREIRTLDASGQIGRDRFTLSFRDK